MSRTLIAVLSVLVLVLGTTCALAAPPPLLGTLIANAQTPLAPTCGIGSANDSIMVTPPLAPPDVGAQNITVINPAEGAGAVATFAAMPAQNTVESALARTTGNDYLAIAATIGTYDEGGGTTAFHALC